ncbi:hypothetical protein BaRGS_00021151 [Batillaria attramentaria]|uniref:Secreted protein n=1 Tax=Batillaria attramentaria TaxID=370345 RepID=A0ABD0KK57_9CAEN
MTSVLCAYSTCWSRQKHTTLSVLPVVIPSLLSPMLHGPSCALADSLGQHGSRPYRCTESTDTALSRRLTKHARRGKERATRTAN